MYYFFCSTRFIHDVGRYFLVSSSLFGFFAFDALYATVVVNYVSQSELIIYFLRSIMVKTRVKSQQLNEVIKVQMESTPTTDCL